MERKTYTYDVTRDGRFWLMNVPELDQLTQARYLGEIELMVRDLIATWTETDPDSFDLEPGTFDLPGTAGAHLDAATRLWLEADLEAGLAAQALRGAEVGVKDIGRILGVSYVIVRRLLANADGVDRIRGMAEEREHYADPANQVPTGPPVRRTHFVGPAAAKLETLMARPGMPEKVLDVLGALARADAAVAATEADDVDTGDDVDR